ncbi:MAG: hypothetical protein M0P99_00300 [Candidatus Cloacimonetes bacterium]|nr:hypothetical protein [Candidatus Cloacimonadota bacterium]
MNDKIYEMPSSMEELVIDKYQRIMELGEDRTSIDDMIEVISILSGMDKELISILKIESLKTLNNLATTIFKTGPSAFVQHFELDGVWYEFDSNFSNMNIGKYSDLTKLSEPGLVNKNLHTIMALMYIPSNKKKKRNILDFIKSEKANLKEEYEPSKIEERADLFKEKLTMNIVLSCVLFISILRSAIYLSKSGISDEDLEEKVIELLNSVSLKM